MERVITNVTALLEVRGDVDTVLTAATYIGDHGFAPFGTLRLVESDDGTIVSDDETYESLAPRLDLKAVEDEWQWEDKYFSGSPDPQQTCRIQHGPGGQSMTAVRQRR